MGEDFVASRTRSAWAMASTASAVLASTACVISAMTAYGAARLAGDVVPVPSSRFRSERRALAAKYCFHSCGVSSAIDQAPASPAGSPNGPQQAELDLTQAHPLIRDADEYGEPFSRCASQHPTTTTTAAATTTTTEDSPA